MESLYVCLFSNGHIKVGRSIDPQSRIATHADRVSCMGVVPGLSAWQECKGSAVQAEAELIARCQAAATACYLNEWFSGLDFDTVAQWLGEAADKERPAQPEVSALRAFLNRLPHGTQQDFATKVGINVMYLRQLAAGWQGRKPSAEVCVRIERATNGQVTRRDLRQDWLDIWPELAAIPQ